MLSKSSNYGIFLIILPQLGCLNTNMCKWEEWALPDPGCRINTVLKIGVVSSHPVVGPPAGRAWIQPSQRILHSWMDRISANTSAVTFFLPLRDVARSREAADAAARQGVPWLNKPDRSDYKWGGGGVWMKGAEPDRRDFDDPDYSSLKSCSSVNSGKSQWSFVPAAQETEPLQAAGAACVCVCACNVCTSIHVWTYGHEAESVCELRCEELH